MSHSKRNTSRPVFTAHERALAKAGWGSSTARLNRDSFLPFGSCGLCLESAREPVACPQGDVFCHECALANVVAQKSAMKRGDTERRQVEIEDARSKEEQAEEERDRSVRDFELTQSGFNKTKLATSAQMDDISTKEPIQTLDEPHSDKTSLVLGAKRKFVLDPEELALVDQRDRAKARKALDEEKGSKPTLPSFWTPSLTPDVKDGKLPAASQKRKTLPVCPASLDDQPHYISMQKLTLILFDTLGNTKAGEKTQWSCPSCRKSLSNATKPVMAKKCGHVLCFSCVKQFLLPSRKKSNADDHLIACYVCNAPIKSTPSSAVLDSTDALPSGLVALKSEGTGFSARGNGQVKRTDVAFKC